MPAKMIDLQYRLARALYDVVLGDAEDWDQTWQDAYRAERACIIASMPAEARTPLDGLERSRAADKR